jgi:hypothetical protein
LANGFVIVWLLKVGFANCHPYLLRPYGSYGGRLRGSLVKFGKYRVSWQAPTLLGIPKRQASLNDEMQAIVNLEFGDFNVSKFRI